MGVARDFLSPALARGLSDNLHRLYAANSLISAGTGNKAGITQDQAVRRDKICWLDRSNENLHEADFFRLMDHFIGHLNATCYTGIKDYEFHYALYEPGSFYKRHRDQFRNDDSRRYSMIMYLNKDWQTADGGELCIYQDDNQPKLIPPRDGTSVFFKSCDLEHEVLTTHTSRMSITGWLKV